MKVKEELNEKNSNAETGLIIKDLNGNLKIGAKSKKHFSTNRGFTYKDLRCPVQKQGISKLDIFQ